MPEIMVFAVSMSSTMGYMFPAPIDMDDNDTIISDKDINNNQEKVTDSRWMMIGDLLKIITDRVTGCDIDMTMIRYLSEDAIVIHGNAKDKIFPITHDIQYLRTCYESEGMSTPEVGLKEIKKAIKSDVYDRRTVYWFLDVESFLTMSKCQFDLPEYDEMMIYVVGEIRTLHDSYEIAKELATYLEGIEKIQLEFLLCRTDINDLKTTLLSVKRLETYEFPVDFILAREKIPIKLHGTMLNDNKWTIEAMNMVGIIPQIELNRLGAMTEKPNECDIFYVEMMENVEKTQHVWLYGLTRYLIDEKPCGTVLCQLLIKKGEEIEYGLLVPVNGPFADDIGLMLIRLKEENREQWAELLELDMVDSVDQKCEKLPNEMSIQIATFDTKIIRQRLISIEQYADNREIFEQKFEELHDEYSGIQQEQAFMAFCETWLQKMKKKLYDDKTE